MSAQSKVAHINKEELVKAMPAYAVAQAEVEKLGKTYQAQIQDSLKELDAKLKQYNAEAEAQTQEENQRRMEEVEGMKQSLAQFQQNAQQDMQKKEFDLLTSLEFQSFREINGVVNNLIINKQTGTGNANYVAELVSMYSNNKVLELTPEFILDYCSDLYQVDKRLVLSKNQVLFVISDINRELVTRAMAQAGW